MSYLWCRQCGLMLGETPSTLAQVWCPLCRCWRNIDDCEQTEFESYVKLEEADRLKGVR